MYVNYLGSLLPQWPEYRGLYRFLDRSIGLLPVRYCNELKDRDYESDNEIICYRVGCIFREPLCASQNAL